MTKSVSQGTVWVRRLAAPWLILSSSQQELIKWTAVLTMTLDHANRTLWPFQSWAFAIGRLAFPLFVFLIAYNLSVRKVLFQRYRVPLLVFGTVSQLPVIVVLERSFLPLNILFTLFLGVTFKPVLRYAKRFMPTGFALFNVVLVWSLLGLFTEYGPVGVLLIPTVQVLLEQPSLYSAGLVAVLLPAANLFVPASLVPLVLPLIIWGVTRLQLGKLPRVRWAFYAFYPAHLLVLGWLGNSINQSI